MKLLFALLLSIFLSGCVVSAETINQYGLSGGDGWGVIPNKVAPEFYFETEPDQYVFLSGIKNESIYGDWYEVNTEDKIFSISPNNSMTFYYRNGDSFDADWLWLDGNHILVPEDDRYGTIIQFTDSTHVTLFFINGTYLTLNVNKNDGNL